MFTDDERYQLPTNESNYQLGSDTDHNAFLQTTWYNMAARPKACGTVPREGGAQSWV